MSEPMDKNLTRDSTDSNSVELEPEDEKREEDEDEAAVDTCEFCGYSHEQEALKHSCEDEAIRSPYKGAKLGLSNDKIKTELRNLLLNKIKMIESDMNDQT